MNGDIRRTLHQAVLSRLDARKTGLSFSEDVGRWRYRHGGPFASEEPRRATIDRMVSKVNRRLDESSPYVDARLPDGSRINAIIPPVCLSGPCLTIRKFRKEPCSREELVGSRN